MKPANIFVLIACYITLLSCSTSRASLSASTYRTHDTIAATFNGRAGTSLFIVDSIFSVAFQPCLQDVLIDSYCQPSTGQTSFNNLINRHQLYPVYVRKASLRYSQTKTDSALTIRDLERTDTAASITLSEHPPASVSNLQSLILIFVFVAITIGVVVEFINLLVGKKWNRWQRSASYNKNFIICFNM